MIPTETLVKKLWTKYHLPKAKQVHVSLVATVAEFLAVRCKETSDVLHINIPLLVASALLHDIDKAVPKLPGEQHPEGAVRILNTEGMNELARVVRTHALQCILSSHTRPRTWEERLLYLADKMVKQEIITVDARFALWRSEVLPENARKILDQTYPKVKALEKEIFQFIHVKPDDVAKLV